MNKPKATPLHHAFVDGIYHHPQFQNGKEFVLKLMRNRMHKYLEINEIQSVENSDKPENITQEKSKSQRISSVSQDYLMEVLKMGLYHLIFLLSRELKGLKVRSYSIPYILRNLPKHPMESFFILRSIDDAEFEKLQELEVGAFLKEDIPIHPALPTDMICISLVYRLIRSTEKTTSELPALFDSGSSLSRYKTLKVLERTGRFIPFLYPDIKPSTKASRYLLESKRLLAFDPNQWDKLFENTNAQSISGISDFLDANASELLSDLDFPELKIENAVHRRLYSLLRFAPSDEVVNLLNIDLSMLFNAKRTTTDYLLIQRLLIESSAWHQEKDKCAHYVTRYIRKQKIFTLPEYMNYLLFDALDTQQFNTIWKSIGSVLNVSEFFKVNVSLQKVKSHYISASACRSFLSRDRDEWILFQSSTKNEKIEEMWMKFVQVVHPKAIPELKGFLKVVFISPEVEEKVNKILYYRTKFQENLNVKK